MKPLIGTPRTVFRAGETRYFWEDVLLAGILREEWAPFARQVHEELACARRQQSAGEPLPTADIEAAAAEFRYARGLVAAAEMHAWLDDWGLPVGEWMAFIRRAYLRDHAGDSLTRAAAEFPPSPKEVADAMPATFVCSGVAARFAKRLAERAAAYERVHPRAASVAIDERCARFPGDVDLSPFGAIDADRLQERKRLVAGLEVAYERFREQVVTPQALQRQMEAGRLDWIRVDYRSVAFSRKSVAREAVLCIRDEGLDVGAVAEQAGAVVQSESRRLADLSGEMRYRLLAARTGELVGPLPESGGFVIHHVDAKRLPSLDDRDVCERVEAIVVQTALDAAVNDVVQWHVAL